ncbi:hypothetical protein Hdeb2414_s0008g00285901 [Helianthus debilis subsp. tardiflorus]
MSSALHKSSKVFLGFSSLLMTLRLIYSTQLRVLLYFLLVLLLMIFFHHPGTQAKKSLSESLIGFEVHQTAEKS